MNGASGIVRYSDRTDTIWIEFDDRSKGKELRSSKNDQFHSNIFSTWTPVTRIARQFRIGRNQNAEIMRKQFPLRPAAAKTVHRCQDDTLNEVVVVW